jgi:hypothetical protein
MHDYIVSVFNVFQLVNRKAEKQQDKRMKMVGLVIFNYVKFMANKYNVDLKNINEPESINLIPIFEYVAANDIELYDFNNIDHSFTIEIIEQINQLNTPGDETG